MFFLQKELNSILCKQISPCKDTLSDQGDGHPVLESRDGRPLPGSLLTGGVSDLLQQELAFLVLVLQDGRRDLDEEGVELALVPLVEDLAHLIISHAKSILVGRGQL